MCSEKGATLGESGRFREEASVAENASRYSRSMFRLEARAPSQICCDDPSEQKASPWQRRLDAEMAETPAQHAAHWEGVQSCSGEYYRKDFPALIRGSEGLLARRVFASKQCNP